MVRESKNNEVSKCSSFAALLRGNSLVAPDSWVVYPLLKGPLEMGEGLGAAPEPHLLTEVVPALPTYATLSAWDTDFQCHSITNGEAVHLGANGDHYP
jgi:hypothetical protein